MEDKSISKDEIKVKRDCPAGPAGTEDPFVMEEFEIEELSVDGICGVY